MGGKLYLNGIIIPNKCGSRYFHEISDIVGDPIFVSIFGQKVDWSRINYVVIRDPIEIFHSALHTEYFNSAQHTDFVIEKMLDLKRGGDHFNSRFYFNLYKKWEEHQFKIINISDLSEFVKKISNREIEMLENKHTSKQFHSKISKEDTYNFFMINYPEEIKKIEEYIEEDYIWYEILKSKG